MKTYLKRIAATFLAPVHKTPEDPLMDLLGALMAAFGAGLILMAITDVQTHQVAEKKPEQDIVWERGPEPIEPDGEGT